MNYDELKFDFVDVGDMETGEVVRFTRKELISLSKSKNKKNAREAESVLKEMKRRELFYALLETKTKAEHDRLFDEIFDVLVSPPFNPKVPENANYGIKYWVKPIPTEPGIPIDQWIHDFKPNDRREPEKE